MKILFLTTIILTKSRNGGEVASQCFIEALRQLGHQVIVLGYLRKGDVLEQGMQDTLVVDERYTETSKSTFYSIFWLTLSLVNGLPYSSTKYYSIIYKRMVNKLLSTGEYSLVIIDHSQLFWLERYVENKERLITIYHNIEHQIYRDSSKNASNFILKFIYEREAYLIKSQEDALATKAKQVWILTQNDFKYVSSLEGINGARSFALSPGSGKLQDKPISKNFDIGLLASWTWKANEEALQWFLQAVYPHLPANLLIHVAGKGADWLTNKYNNINYRGVVPDAQEFMAQAKVFAIPTLSGAGIQIKTLDAIASGSAIVATPVALRGISDPPSTVQIAEQPEAFANLLISAVASPSVQSAFDNAREWYHTRRNKFLADIACAINEF